MTTEFIYRVYVSGERHIVGFGSPGLGDSPGQATMFTDSQIEELKKLSKDEQEEYAIKLKSG
jgi:hypothetical protein